MSRPLGPAEAPLANQRRAYLPVPDPPSTGPVPVPRADSRLLRDEVFGLVYAQMRSLAGRTPDLDDLVQAAAEQALRALPAFEGRSALATWTFRICYHTMLNERRWYKRWFRRFTLTSDGTLPDLEDVRPGPNEVLELLERATRVRAALERVSPKRRAVVILHDLEGLPLDEVVEIVGANLLTVRSRLRDGRRRLLSELTCDPYFGHAAAVPGPVKEAP
jgi:RNA polymerase sigma-70 factor, ECF subfamily